MAHSTPGRSSKSNYNIASAGRSVLPVRVAEIVRTPRSVSTSPIGYTSASTLRVFGISSARRGHSSAVTSPVGRPGRGGDGEKPQ
jgi:hypothetical protein